MIDMTKFTTDELHEDLRASNADILLCKLALAGGVTAYSGGKVSERLEANIAIKAMIKAELTRRGASIEVAK